MPQLKSPSAATQRPIFIPVDLYRQLAAAQSNENLKVVTRKTTLGVEEKLVQLTRKEFQTLTEAATRAAPKPAPQAPTQTWGTTATKVAVLAGALVATVAGLYYAFEHGKNAGIDQVFSAGYTKAMNTAAQSCLTSTRIDSCVNNAFKSTVVGELSILPDWVHTAYQYASFQNLVIADHIGRYVLPNIIPIAFGAATMTVGGLYALRNPILGGARAVKNTLWPEGEWTAKKMAKLVLVWGLFMAATGYGMYRYGKSVGTTFGLKEWTAHTAQGMKQQLLTKFSGLLGAHRAKVEHQMLIGSGLKNGTPTGSELVDVSNIGTALADRSASQLGSAVANSLDHSMALQVADVKDTAVACMNEAKDELAQRSPTIFQAASQTAEETKTAASWTWTVLEWAPYVNTAKNWAFDGMQVVSFVGTLALMAGIRR